LIQKRAQLNLSPIRDLIDQGLRVFREEDDNDWVNWRITAPRATRKKRKKKEPSSITTSMEE